MNKTQIETFIKRIREGSENPRLIHLCDAFEAFMALYTSRNQKRGNAEHFEKKLHSSYRTLWDSFYAVADSFGLDGPALLEHMSDPSRLHPEWREGMNSLRQSIEVIESQPPARSAKKKSRKKNVRI